MLVTRREFGAILWFAQNEDVSHETLLEVLGQFTSALSEGNAEAAIGVTDSMGTLGQQLRDLLASHEVGSAIDPIEWTDKQTVVLDWLLEIRSADPVGAVKRKREKVTCRFIKKGKRWKIAALDPVSFFQ